MVEDLRVYNQLIRIAGEGKVIPICDVGRLLGLDSECSEDRTQIYRILNDISCQENAAGRPMLSVIAIRPEIGYPPMGFFRLAQELGRNLFCDERSFFSYELKRVHEYWKHHMPVAEIYKVILQPLPQKPFLHSII